MISIKAELIRLEYDIRMIRIQQHIGEAPKFTSGGGWDFEGGGIFLTPLKGGGTRIFFTPPKVAGISFKPSSGYILCISYEPIRLFSHERMWPWSSPEWNFGCDKFIIAHSHARSFQDISMKLLHNIFHILINNRANFHVSILTHDAVR